MADIDFRRVHFFVHRDATPLCPHRGGEFQRGKLEIDVLLIIPDGTGSFSQWCGDLLAISPQR